MKILQRTAMAILCLLIAVTPAGVFAVDHNDTAAGTEINNIIPAAFIAAEEPAEAKPAPVAKAAYNDGGIAIRLNGAELRMSTPAIKVNGKIFLPVRAFAETQGCWTYWDDANKRVMVGKESAGFSLTATVAETMVTAKGRSFYMSAACYEAPNYTIYLPMTDMTRIFGMSNSVSNENGKAVVTLNADKPFLPAEQFYNQDDLNWLARIINAESGGEPLMGKIGVGSVVMNRVHSPRYPDTIYGVIFDCRYGVQFTPTRSGAINRKPNAESVLAAKLCLEGTNNMPGAMYFVSRRSAANGNWYNKHTLVSTIGNHCFFS